MSKKNKTACITGAGNGIGRAISIAMGNEGYNIVCADINSDHANETLDTIKKNNGLGIVIKLSLIHI